MVQRDAFIQQVIHLNTNCPASDTECQGTLIYRLLLLCSDSPPPLCILWVRPWQADCDGGGRSHVVSLHHLPAHLQLHQHRMDQPRQQPHGRLQSFGEETCEGKVVRHVPTAPAVPLVEAQVNPARQGAIAVRGKGC